MTAKQNLQALFYHHHFPVLILNTLGKTQNATKKENEEWELGVSTWFTNLRYNIYWIIYLKTITEQYWSHIVLKSSQFQVSSLNILHKLKLIVVSQTNPSGRWLGMRIKGIKFMPRLHPLGKTDFSASRQEKNSALRWYINFDYWITVSLFGLIKEKQRWSEKWLKFEAHRIFIRQAPLMSSWWKLTGVKCLHAQKALFIKIPFPYE